MEIKLNKNCQRIYNILEDKEWHCPIEWGYADGHCRRFTDLKQKGFVIESKVCECGRHESKVLARRLIATPADYVKPQTHISTVASIWAKPHAKDLSQKLGTCCYSMIVFGTHDRNCPKAKPEVKQLNQQVLGI